MLGVTGMGASLEDARSNVYNELGLIGFDKMHFRKDVGLKGLSGK